MQTTPMMEQYMSFKNQYPDKVLLFRMGDFFETFGDDAKLVSKVLNITLTTRDKKADPTPLAGFPHHALDQYLPKLIHAGYCAVIVDQIEDPRFAKGIVKRAVTRIVTPGTLDSDNVEKVKNSYIGAFFLNKKELGAAFVDLAVGSFSYINMQYKPEALNTLMNSFDPVEALVITGEKELVFRDIPVQLIDKGYGNSKYCESIITDFYDVKTVDGFGLDSGDAAVNAIAMIIGYVQETQKIKPAHLEVPKKFILSNTMILDRATINNLEIVQGGRSGSYKDSIFGVIDYTKTTMGRRLLYSWLLNPLVDIKALNERLGIVDSFYSNESLLEDVRNRLSEINDIERIVGKIGMNRANARDLKALQFSIDQILELNSLVKENKDVLKSFKEKESVEAISKVRDLIDRSIIDNPPLAVTEAHIIKTGYNPEVDEIRSLTGDSKTWIKEFEDKEKKRTGISSLKVGFNKVFGYYIEVTNSHKDKVPDDYIRKQTLVNNERFITEELKEKESIILNAEEKSSALEYKIFQQIREELLGYIKVLQNAAKDIAIMDVLAGFAYLAKVKSYIRPTLFDFGQKDGKISIENGRHPVVEAISEDEFVSNDTEMNMTDSRMVILTGPNMSGKSTYIRQVAVIALLAQVGCYVPASKCELELVDRIFTRVGASDDLSRGRSTFMVEMNEAANIVNNATKYSLVVLDEVGRGTSTYDGVSIAWALAEHLANEVRCRTLFATHYHELLKLSENNDKGIKNYNVLVEEDTDKGIVIFLRKIVEGGTDRSYGIYVAKMAGLPEKVVQRANEILESFEQGSLFTNGVTLRGESVISKKNGNVKLKKEDLQIPLFQIEDSEMVKELRDLDVDSITPVDALNIIARWKKKSK